MGVSLYFWLAFVLTAPIGVALGVMVFLVTALFDKDRRAVHRFLCLWGFDYLRLNPLWKAEVHFRERIPDRPCVLVANHRSMADVVAALGLQRNFKFVSKASLFKLPLVGWMMRLARYVELERGQLASTRKMWETCRGFLERGTSVLLFPEGTYAADGRMLPFRRGAFTLAMETQVPIVPVVLQGTDTLVHEDGPWMSARARVDVTVLAPVMPESFGPDVQALSDRVRAMMRTELEPSRAG